jgi:hypothetical protein
MKKQYLSAIQDKIQIIENKTDRICKNKYFRLTMRDDGLLRCTMTTFLTDRQGLPLALSSPLSGSHHDLYQIESALSTMFETITSSGISLDGLFVNADAGFDSKEFRETCSEKGIFANVDFNKRNGGMDENYDYLLDEMLYYERYSIERTNAWMDSFRSILNRFDFTVASWEGFNYIAFMVILLRKIKKQNKSK